MRNEGGIIVIIIPPTSQFASVASTVPFASTAGSAPGTHQPDPRGGPSRVLWPEVQVTS